MSYLSPLFNTAIIIRIKKFSVILLQYLKIHSKYDFRNSRIWPNRCWWRMLVTKCFGDNFEMLPTWDVSDGFGRFRPQHPLSKILYLRSSTYLRHPLPSNISVGYQHSKDVTNIEILSPTPKHCHQHLCSHRIKLSIGNTRKKQLNYIRDI